MFKYLITVSPLGLMYGSTGGFLSPENLVGLSRSKFPPEAATLAGLIFSYHKAKNQHKSQEERKNLQEQISKELFIAGPFWAKCKDTEYFYVPIPWTKIIANDGVDEWSVEENKWQHKQANEEEIEPEYTWQRIDSWDESVEIITSNESEGKIPWKPVSFLHPRMKDDQRHVKDKDGLFLEYAFQLDEDACLVYLSTCTLPEGWYRFGGENHIVEINCKELAEDHPFIEKLKQPIGRSFALISPGVWGSNRFSYRYPQHSDFPKPLLMLTDKPVPYRYRAAGRLGRGRYAVPAGSVYVLEQPINQSWWDWPEKWFPEEGYSLKRVGCGLCLRLTIEGVNNV